MKQPEIGFVRVQVGDYSIMSKAYRALHAAVDRGEVSVSDAGLQRFRELLSQIEDCSCERLGASDIWLGRAY